MHKPFDELRERLLAAGIAPRHVRRYLAELDDHLDELRREGVGAGEALTRLGTADDLARPMLERPEFRSWAARLPWLVMVLGPVAAMIVSGIALGFLAVGLALIYRWFAPWPGRVEPMPVQFLLQTAAAFIVLLLPLLVGWGAAAVAIRQRLHPLWPLIGLGAFAVLSGTFGIELRFPKVLGEHGELSLGFSWLSESDGLDRVIVSPVRWIANLALLIGPYLAWRTYGASAWRGDLDITEAVPAQK